MKTIGIICMKLVINAELLLSRIQKTCDETVMKVIMLIMKPDRTCGDNEINWNNLYEISN